MKIWLKLLIILLISAFAFLIDAGVPFAILILLIYFELIYKKKENARSS